jgi:hypothetical protein
MGAIERAEPWLGKDVLFIRAGQFLLEYDRADGMLSWTPDEARRLREAAMTGYRALRWHAFLTRQNNDRMPDLAQESHTLVNGVLRRHYPDAELASAWKDLASIVATLNAIVVDQWPSREQVVLARQWCGWMGEAIMDLHRSAEFESADDE